LLQKQMAQIQSFYWPTPPFYRRDGSYPPQQAEIRPAVVLQGRFQNV